MVIDIGNVIVACVTVGASALWLEWPGFFGSIAGQVVYFAWLRDLLFS